MTFRLALSRVAIGAVLFAGFSANAQNQTYAEKLGWPEGTRAVILHIDDAGMSWDSNLGTRRAMTEGVATSCSVMMPCPWVPDIVRWIKENPEIDAGLHLTLNAEWGKYRWGPVAGKPAVPGLVDKEGAMWSSTQQTVMNASADEIETEVRAQIDRARTMGFEPTHLDTHMGTILATDAFTERYLKIGMETGIPVMLPVGHNFYAKKQYGERAGAQAQMMGQILWNAGLPVLDDLHNTSYGWKTTDKTDQYIEVIKGTKPGVTMIIMHCTDPTEIFTEISSSSTTREGDLNAMLDPRLRKAIQDEGIVLTTWRELKERRDEI